MQPKDELRSRLIAARRQLDDDARESARTAIRHHVLAWVSRSSTPARIACYEPLRTEPGSIELLADLTRLGVDVLVPVTLSDLDLDWAIWTRTRQARQPLGRAAIASAGLVIVPALAAGRDGTRLGRGGGSYDRALTRIAPETPVAALLYEDELLDTVPTEPWDVAVTAVVTPSAWVEVGASQRPGTAIPPGGSSTPAP